MYDKKAVGERIRTRRKALDISQEKFAERIGNSARTSNAANQGCPSKRCLESRYRKATQGCLRSVEVISRCNSLRSIKKIPSSRGMLPLKEGI